MPDAGAGIHSGEALIGHQQALLREALAGVLAPGQDYALVDFPNYSNVGDSAIWVGARSVLQDVSGRAPAYTSTISGFDRPAFERAVANGPIVITGGGNFGDLWPSHQDFREKLLELFPARPVIQLPQSIKFDDARRARRFADLAGRHGCFTLMVRDRASRNFARDVLGIDARLVPDCAIYLGPQSRRVAPQFSTVLLLRTDAERAAVPRHPFRLLADSCVFDWIDESPDLFTAARRRANFAALRHARFDRRARRLALFDLLARRRLERGLAMLSGGRSVITDRLHGHILALLLDLPHVTLDNSYGKLSGYAGAWSTGYARHRSAATAESAIAALGEIR